MTALKDIKTKLRHATYKLKSAFQPTNLVITCALTLCAVWAISAVATMSKNWEGQHALESARLESARFALEVEMSKLNQEYYRSAEYKELVARATLNKAFEGETLIVLPKNSTRAINKYAEVSTVQDSAPTSNFSQWLSFLFH